MHFFKAVIAAVATVALVSAGPLRQNPLQHGMCHDEGAPCDRPSGQCCPWLSCDLGAYDACVKSRRSDTGMSSSTRCAMIGGGSVITQTNAALAIAITTCSNATSRMHLSSRTKAILAACPRFKSRSMISCFM
ncbi:MAG: hypothetical protein J3Q66DRAFT_139923 [Benniella sp.]|nr:MAG: hypothetical protein J3Q66DRAFT_139923 [Benniella sp.]